MAEPISEFEWGLVSGRWVNYQGRNLDKLAEGGMIYGFTSVSRRQRAILIETFSEISGRTEEYPYVSTVETFSIEELERLTKGLPCEVAQLVSGDVSLLAGLVLKRVREYGVVGKVRRIYGDEGTIDRVSVYPFKMSEVDYRTVANIPKFQNDALSQLELLIQRGKS